MSLIDQIKSRLQKNKAATDQAEALLSHPAETEMANLSGYESRYTEVNSSTSTETLEDLDTMVLPFLGRRPVGMLRNLGFGIVGVSAIAFIGLSAFTINRSNNVSAQVAATGDALMQSQRLAKSVSLAMVGDTQGIKDVGDSYKALSTRVNALEKGSADVPALGTAYQSDIKSIDAPVKTTVENAKTILQHSDVLTKVGSSLRNVNRQSSDLLEIAEAIAALKLAQNAPASEIAATGQLVMLTQRIGKSANEFLTAEGVSPEGVFLLGKDLNAFKENAEGLLNGNEDLKLHATTDPQVRERLDALLKQYEEMRGEASAILDNLPGLVAAREANAGILADSERLRLSLQALQDKLSHASGLGSIALLLLLPILMAALAGWLLVRLQVRDGLMRQKFAESQQQEAQQQEFEAKRINDANQAAILRLMNELQSVAEGDLTQEATVTEDITGAIADSVNYTVEELRSLVGNVQNTATRVAQTSSNVESTSTELLAASTEQLREIRETGQSVLDMAGRINQVSGQAQQSADVARQSLQAAEQGLQAVQNAIGGMNAIRDQIQDTSKRIKRLGESSQEIGEITELISDITEQTNVLALNAAIQAASAGEAGRGFSVVAEEVQRLAERSGDATKQIAALVKTIQTDTQDAVAAMERSTRGVVEGAALSDNDGTALTEIDRVSRRLSDLIEDISQAASKEAQSANVVAANIQHIFAVTEQTGAGTRATADQVRELNRMAEELRQSVSRFKIA
ncbi:MAG: methyl-accepting chemotaxis protein [Brachymonas sp.]